MSSFAYGRSSFVGSLKPGEKAVFDLGKNRGTGIAFGAIRPADPERGSEASDVIVAELAGSNRTRFGLVP